MSDDLGRGMLGWTAERWQALDTLAAQTVTANVVLRNLVDHREDVGARSARIAGQNVDVDPIQEQVDIDVDKDEDEDIERKIRLAAQVLAVKEDKRILRAFNTGKPQISDTFDHKAFSLAKSELGKKGGVQNGFGVIVSTDALADLEIDIAGTQSGLDVTERVLGTKIVQTNALRSGRGEVEAVLFQASPPVYRVVFGDGPRLRVLKVDGQDITLQLEEYLAVGELEANRSLAIERGVPAVVAAPPARKEEKPARV